MSLRGISFACDRPNCWAYRQITAPTIESAFEVAKSKYGWSERDGQHLCAPCTRPACCRCSPRCAEDETGDQCATAGCGWCMHGCPAADEAACCQNGNRR
ncbi:hypothetical protein AB0L05_27875 [Nonomuraea pusilla]|uniref:hypothetical protein n=1 Tax=Nonomuraea pusilla TaxID=46177 RepID=UPI00332FE93C